jgi:hypothetical protein
MADLLSNARIVRIACRLAARIDDEGVLDFPPRKPMTPEEAKVLGVDELAGLVKEAAMELAIGQRLTERDLAEPERMRRVEVNLMQGVEDRRRYEEWRLGKRLLLTFQPFRRTDDATGAVLELRAGIREEQPDDGVFLRTGDGTWRHWPGPGTPRPEEAEAADPALPPG